MEKSLADIREEIDKIDDSIAQALVNRAKLAKAVRDFKQGNDIQVYHPSREREILDRVYKICAESGFSAKQVDKVFLSVISACRSIVGDLEICIANGVCGLAHAAVTSQFGPVDQIFCVNSVEEVFARVEEGSSQYGIVPVSKVNDGILGETLFAFLGSNQLITAEVDVKNICSLYSNAQTKEEIKQVFIELELYSTLNFTKLKEYFSNSVLIMPFSVQDSLDIVAGMDKDRGIIAPAILNSYLSIPALVENLDISPIVEERFFVIGAPEPNQSKHNVYSLICVVKDRSGILREILEPFEKEDLTLLTLESRTSKNKKWECAFYIEVQIPDDSERLSRVIKNLNTRCSYVRQLGTFYRGAE